MSDHKLTDTWPPRYVGPAFKGSRTATKKAKLEDRRELKTEEDKNKRTAKKRDRHRCRFPLCGCSRLKFTIQARLESSHHKHKGMGGDKTGARNGTANLCSLCGHRHQDGKISRHKGTLRPKFLTRDGFDGLIAWEVDTHALSRAARAVKGSKWVEVAREVAIQEWAPFTPKQREILERLAEMEE